MEETKLRIGIILSLQGALVGNISRHVRAICCDWKDTDWFKLKFLLDIESNETEEELMSIVLTEFENNIETFGFQFKKYMEEIVFAHNPIEDIDTLKFIMFWRNETPVL